MNAALQETLSHLGDWTPPAVPADIPRGDMPGDKIQIGQEHIQKANTIFPLLVQLLAQAAQNDEKPVVSVFGGSGVGKSEIASLLGWYLRCAGIGCYILSGDNYPRRIPMYNDAERQRVFRVGGLRGLLDEGLYSESVQAELTQLWARETDAAPDPELPWLAAYQRHGRAALDGYLGTDLEQDFDEINGVLAAFRSGAERAWFKRMGRSEDERWYSQIDLRGVQVLILEWTHGGSAALEGVDIPILLNSTPEETREHRRLRARDGKTDSPFTTMVLELEQAKLAARAPFAKIALSKSGELLDPAKL